MIRRLFQFVRRSRRTIREDVETELRFHLEARVADLMAEGLDADAARRQAHREFGNLDDARRYMRRIDYRTELTRRRRDDMGELRHDIRYAIRRLKASPGFAATAILTLALGIGANTAIFSIVNGVLFRPLPFRDSGNLYTAYSANRTGGLLQAPVSPVDLDDWRAQRRAIEDVGGYFYAEGTSGIDLTGRGDPRRLAAVFVTPGFFTTLGINAVAGRLPREDEMIRGGRDRVVMLAHRFWLSEFGGSDSIVGTSLTLNGVPYEVVGVLPADFRYPSTVVDVFVPYSTIPDSAIPRRRQVRVLNVVARARPGVDRDMVQAELDTIAQRLAEAHPENRAWNAATVVPLRDVLTGPVRKPLLVLLGAVAFVLLMAAVNVAGLQLARAAGLGREMSVRMALGARRGRLVRQLLTESLVLSTIGCGVGLAVAVGLTGGLMTLAGSELPRQAEIRLDAPVLIFSIALSMATGLLSGLVPALRGASGGGRQVLLQGSRGTIRAESRRLRMGLVVTEVALAVVLIAGAGLMGRSFLALLHVDAGFNPDRLVAVQFTISADRYDRAAARSGTAAGEQPGPRPYVLFYERVIEKVRALPGVISAAAVKDPPFRGNGERGGFRIPGQPVPADHDPPSATAIHVSDGYFRTIGARIHDGREFTPRDRFGAPFVLVVNEAFARQFFPGQRAVGRRLLFGTTEAEIIGVVNDIRQLAMAEPARPTMYIHNLQNARVKTTIVARTEGEPMAMAGAIRDAVWSLDPAQAITSVFTFDESVDRALARPRLVTFLLLSFAGIGLVLGAIGIYGVLAFLVEQRRREIGVRLALGARRGEIAAMFLRRGLSLTAAGVAIGLASALVLSQFLVAVLYDVEPTDPMTFAGVAVVLLLAAVAASTLPALRAARVDPVETLRVE